MNYYIEDSQNALRNTVTCFSINNGAAYNAVIATTFTGEDATEPILLQEAKDWLRIDVTDDDSLITKLIKAARIVCENYANLSFINRTVTAKIHNGLGNFYLPYGPVKSVTSIIDKDGNGVTDYEVVDPYSTDITIEYEAGFEALPEDLRTAVLDQVAFMYQNRGDAKVASSLSLESMLVLNQYRNV